MTPQHLPRHPARHDLEFFMLGFGDAGKPPHKDYDTWSPFQQTIYDDGRLTAASCDFPPTVHNLYLAYTLAIETGALSWGTLPIHATQQLSRIDPSLLSLLNRSR